MNSNFSLSLMECTPTVVPGGCVQYGITPSTTCSSSQHPAHQHQSTRGQGDSLARVPFFLYPANFETSYYDASYGSALFPYVPFHGHFGVYDCPFEPAFIQKRNERERQRVKCVNEGYARLRDHLPGPVSDKRLSKVETLRAAIRYIKYLQELISRTPPEGIGLEHENEDKNARTNRGCRANTVESNSRLDHNSDGECHLLSFSSSSSPYCESEDSGN
ncbi:achaete-scute homolog 5-like [Erpetoichthys calabaricus]|uniref:achaete-scute homolog 5-like n=1 Tax=Erpetoichthys calabaricus TaxID=27687 RepID=UPI00109FA72C|nr:achaete-scute homolog 5-like [Erpetoichthys calabaricus]